MMALGKEGRKEMGLKGQIASAKQSMANNLFGMYNTLMSAFAGSKY